MEIFLSCMEKDPKNKILKKNKIKRVKISGWYGMHIMWKPLQNKRILISNAKDLKKKNPLKMTSVWSSSK